MQKWICTLFELKKFFYCECILATLLKNNTIVKDICYKLGAQFCSVCSPSGLIYYGHTNWLFRRLRPCANLFIIIMCYEVFSYFFQNTLVVNLQQENIAFWCKKTQRYFQRGALLYHVFCMMQIKSVKNTWK